MLLSTWKPSVIIISWKPIFLCYIANKGMIDWIIQFKHFRLLCVPCFCAMNTFMVNIVGFFFLILRSSTWYRFVFFLSLIFSIVTNGFDFYVDDVHDASISIALLKRKKTFNPHKITETCFEVSIFITFPPCYKTTPTLYGS